MRDNIRWIASEENKMVVGAKDTIRRYRRSESHCAFNDAISSGEISAPIVLGSDHHDVAGTDSPFRNCKHFRRFHVYRDMAVHNFVGDSFRGATWISLHNGGKVGAKLSTVVLGC